MVDPRAAQPGDLDERLIPDEQAGISAALIELGGRGLRAGGPPAAPARGCAIVTPKPRWCTHKEMPGFASRRDQSEIACQRPFCPGNVLVVRDKVSIINLPGQPISLKR
jgi:molybdopterin adenylyltransferase